MSEWEKEREITKEFDLKYVRAKKREKGGIKTFSTEQESQLFINNNPDSVARNWSGCASVLGGRVMRARDFLFISPRSKRLTRARFYAEVKRSKDLPIDPCTCDKGKPYDGHLWQLKEEKDGI